MKAVQLSELGPAENLKIVDIPIPKPSENEILIKVKASGIVYPDVLMRKGIAPAKPPLPFIVGREAAGIVAEVGANIKSIKPGMRVMGTMLTGGYAEYAKVSDSEAFILPDKVDYLQGLVYVVNLRVAYMVYYIFGNVQPRQTILVHAASGGIGSLITQIAKRRGNNTVIALAENDAKLEFCRANGADYLINTTTSDYVKEVLRITNGHGVDVSLNSIGGPTLDTDPDAIKPAGRWSIYGYAAGIRDLDIYKNLLKSLTINVSSVYTYIFREEWRQAMDFLKDWLETEPLMSAIKTYRMEEVVQAHHWLEDQHSTGKLAIVYND